MVVRVSTLYPRVLTGFYAFRKAKTISLITLAATPLLGISKILLQCDRDELASLGRAVIRKDADLDWFRYPSWPSFSANLRALIHHRARSWAHPRCAGGSRRYPSR